MGWSYWQLIPGYAIFIRRGGKFVWFWIEKDDHYMDSRENKPRSRQWSRETNSLPLVGTLTCRFHVSLGRFILSIVVELHLLYPKEPYGRCPGSFLANKWKLKRLLVVNRLIFTHLFIVFHASWLRFALALQKASHLLVVPNPSVGVYSRLWCVYEAWDSELGSSMVRLDFKFQNN